MRKAQIVLKRRADMKTILKRARRLAIKAIKERISKKSAQDMTVVDKERAERMLANMKGVIDRLAVKMVPRVRELETSRLHPKADQK
jgi:hypothetical protein